MSNITLNLFWCLFSDANRFFKGGKIIWFKYFQSQGSCQKDCKNELKIYIYYGYPWAFSFTWYISGIIYTSTSIKRKQTQTLPIAYPVSLPIWPHSHLHCILSHCLLFQLCIFYWNLVHLFFMKCSWQMQGSKTLVLIVIWFPHLWIFPILFLPPPYLAYF